MMEDKLGAMPVTALRAIFLHEPLASPRPMRPLFWDWREETSMWPQ